MCTPRPLHASVGWPCGSRQPRNAHTRARLLAFLGGRRPPVVSRRAHGGGGPKGHDVPMFKCFVRLERSQFARERGLGENLLAFSLNKTRRIGDSSRNKTSERLGRPYSVGPRAGFSYLRDTAVHARGKCLGVIFRFPRGRGFHLVLKDGSLLDRCGGARGVGGGLVASMQAARPQRPSPRCWTLRLLPPHATEKSTKKGLGIGVSSGPSNRITHEGSRHGIRVVGSKIAILVFYSMWERDHEDGIPGFENALFVPRYHCVHLLLDCIPHHGPTPHQLYRSQYANNLGDKAEFLDAMARFWSRINDVP